MVTYWLSCLPITHDYEEAFTMTDLLSDLVLNYTMISSLPNQEGIGSTLANIYGEAFDDKYFFWDEDEDKTDGKAAKLKAANAIRQIMDSVSPLSENFKAACTSVLKDDKRQNVEAGYTYTGDQAKQM